MKRNVKDPEQKQSESTVNEKKPFDKKKYRLQKYSNKYKINQWEERRKKAILRGFYKELDKDEKQKIRKPSTSKSDNDNENENDDQPKKINAFYKAQQEFLHKKHEKRKMKEEALRKKQERQEALKRYKEKKMKTYKILSKKTKKGQPVMKDRIEMLLDKIQQHT